MHWNHGILNDIKLERYKKQGLYLNGKKKANPSLKLANSWGGDQDNLVKLHTVVDKNIKRLEVYYDYLLGKQASNLGNSLQKVADLESLIFSFKASHEFADHQLVTIGHSLKALKKLTVLDMEIQEPKRISDRGFYRFAAGLANLSHLKSFTLTIEWCDLADSSVSKLAKSLSELSELRSIDLNIIRLRNLENNFLETLAHSLGKLKKLETLILDISWCINIPEESIVRFSNAVGKLGDSLRHFSFTSRKCQITDASIEAFTNSFSNLTKLQSLTFDTYGCAEVSEVKLCKLFETFEKMEELEKIVLYLGPGRHDPTSFGDFGMKYLGEKLQKCIKLKDFNLTVCEFENLTDQGRIDLGSYLAKIQSLESVNLKCSTCKNLTNEGANQTGQLLSKNNDKITKIFISQ